MKKDVVVGMVGTLILVVAMIGVFRFEAAQAGASWEVTWPTESVAGPSLDGRTEEGASTEASLALNASNVTRVVFKLAWTDDTPNSAPDTLRLEVTAPDGTTLTSEEESDGLIELAFDDVALVPETIRVTASDDAGAQEEASRYASRAAAGGWNVTVVLVDAGATSTPAGEVPVPQDSGNEWTLTTELTAYRANVARPA